MYFTSGSDRAFEQLMQGKPGFDHYDSGEAVTPEDCGTCRFYRPHWKYQFCVYAECPYQPGKLTAYDAVTFRVKGVENMAVFRVERNKGYTVMSNHHLRNKDLSLKAKGLLSQMLSLPEDWDYTLKGLSLINREQIDAIRAAIRELEQAGYIVRSRERDSQGRLRGADYVIYEQPQPVPDHYNNIIQSAGAIELTGKLSLEGTKEKGIDDYTGTYTADYENFSDTEYLFGGTSIKREAGKELSIDCTLEITEGTAKVFWISGSDEAVTLIEATGTYSDTITLPDGGNYIGIACEDFTGNIELNIE